MTSRANDLTERLRRRLETERRGDDSEVLAKLSEEVERRLKTIPEIISLDPDRNRGEDEIRIRIDREQARKLGITPRRVGRTISAGLQGVTLPRFRAGDREVDVRLSLQKSPKRQRFIS